MKYATEIILAATFTYSTGVSIYEESYDLSGVLGDFDNFEEYHQLDDMADTEFSNAVDEQSMILAQQANQETCYKKSKGRGAGRPLHQCPDGWQK